jgi:hypothetical protein
MEGRSKFAAPLGRSRFKGPWPLRTAAMVSVCGSHVNSYRGGVGRLRKRCLGR